MEDLVWFGREQKLEVNVVVCLFFIADKNDEISTFALKFSLYSVEYFIFHV